MSNLDDQRIRALASANEARLPRAKLRRELKRGDISLLDALERPEARDMSVWELVGSQRRWGETRTTALAISLEQNGIPLHYGKTIRSMTVAQKLALLDHASRIPGTWQRRQEVRSGLRCGVCEFTIRRGSEDGLCAFCKAGAREIDHLERISV